MSNGPGDVLFEHSKRSGAVFRAAVRKLGGREFFDMREWAMRDGAPVPTKKGATLPLDQLADLGAALSSFAAEKLPKG